MCLGGRRGEAGEEPWGANELQDLFFKNADLLLAYFLRRGLASEAVESLAAEAFLQATSRPREAGVSFRATLLREARRAAEEKLGLPTRERLLRQRLSEPHDQEGNGNGSGRGGDSLSAHPLGAALLELPEPEREFLLLRVWEGLSVCEAAYVLTLSWQEVKRMQAETLERLRACSKGPQRKETVHAEAALNA